MWNFLILFLPLLMNYSTIINSYNLTRNLNKGIEETENEIALELLSKSFNDRTSSFSILKKTNNLIGKSNISTKVLSIIDETFRKTETFCTNHKCLDEMVYIVDNLNSNADNDENVQNIYFNIADTMENVSKTIPLSKNKFIVSKSITMAIEMNILLSSINLIYDRKLNYFPRNRTKIIMNSVKKENIGDYLKIHQTKIQANQRVSIFAYRTSKFLNLGNNVKIISNILKPYFEKSTTIKDIEVEFSLNDEYIEEKSKLMTICYCGQFINGKWMKSRVKELGETRVKCNFNSSAHLAVLMITSSYVKEDIILEKILFTGLCLSIPCLVCIIISYAFCRSARKTTIQHSKFNLALSLGLLAMPSIVVGVIAAVDYKMLFEKGVL
ncbi:DgyrCDS7802 [Dimorphilus gyrociliatus]|uniref:DgyrCDS7802 n=1 Tax=Dimorphilus gyrociliatus TaxID=2664684 RepID=A0A7I8VX38_9ANNE|nr:DgyrCDS7802 [Dimorphilus gyrociliatus]